MPFESLVGSDRVEFKRNLSSIEAEQLVLSPKLRVLQCSTRFAVAVAFLLTVVMFVSATRAQVAPSSSSQARKRMARAVDRTLQEGLHAKLPPHISTLLGLSQEGECPVLQGAVRTGKVVQGFDVSTANKNDVVLFVVNETANNQILYLTSKEGVLRKVVVVEAGTGRVQKITGEDRKAFEKEKQFWLDRLAPVDASK